jgi:hypothetical protein
MVLNWQKQIRRSRFSWQYMGKGLERHPVSPSMIYCGENVRRFWKILAFQSPARELFD